MELLESPISEGGGYQGLHYMILVTVEEFFEMTGVVVYTYGVLDFLSTRERPVTISIGR